MTTTADALEVMVELTTASSKRAQREIRETVRGLAQIRDYIQTAQSQEGTANDQHREHHS